MISKCLTNLIYLVHLELSMDHLSMASHLSPVTHFLLPPLTLSFLLHTFFFSYQIGTPQANPIKLYVFRCVPCYILSVSGSPSNLIGITSGLQSVLRVYLNHTLLHKITLLQKIESTSCHT